eukprot:scaffold431_cov315-Prasinococcus_capsulatus_cf.AAC.13
MFDQFIAPTKIFADVILPRGGDNMVAVDLIVQHIRSKLGQDNLTKIYPRCAPPAAARGSRSRAGCPCR